MPRRVRVEGDRFHPRFPDGAEYVGREAPHLSRSPFHNPHRLEKPCKVPTCHGVVHERDECLRMFRAHLAEHPELVERARRELAGKDLACRCGLDEACHGDILLEICASAEFS
ncbi:DUF4326 domain-containing protein [Actinomadura sp. HBU206391]|uniref:DUF4326 domain-containing protein n=1 Tax=Actinomadura sp. HBU206391 TaxID=2731692 RepID=UPI00164F84FD|nr:DUF4326 domain-containing protein [Actinomadura sp. HBU206391]MBC6458403.1 DUF4326 domain-containing protein [Actinomadura sp. HBU206391]